MPFCLKKTKGSELFFSVLSINSSDPFSAHDELRLIPKPIYRYELGKPKGATELVDGTVFAFAQGTDPESLLLIEARRSASGLEWHYATAKRTVGQINIRLDGKLVHIHKWGGWSRFEPDAIFTTLRRPIQRDE